MDLIKLAANPFGQIQGPGKLQAYGAGAGGLATLVGIAIKTLIVIAGVYAVFNFVFAGYAYLSAAGDPKAIQGATAKLWQTVIGLIVAAGSLMIAGLIGRILFGDANAILQLQIFTP